MSGSNSDNSDLQHVKSLFNKLDQDKDGKVSVAELSSALQKQYGEDGEKRLAAAQRVIGSEGALTFQQFLKYVNEQNKKLRLAFAELDTNADSKIDASEIQTAMRQLGIDVSKKESERLLNKLDKDGSLSISYDEWRDFLLLTGRANVGEIFNLMRHGSNIDIGESLVIPDDYTQEERQTGVAWRTLVAGGVAGAVSRTSTAPLDRLKVMWQASAGSGGSGSIGSAISGMVREGGMASLWRGNGVNCLKIAPESALKFLTYELYKKAIVGDADRDVLLAEKFAAGALAGATSQTIIYPMEVLKTRMCLRKTGQYSSIFDCARKVYKEGGLKIFYRGYLPNIMGILPYAGIDLALYETFKQSYASLQDDKEVKSTPIYVSLAAGAVSSVCGQVATYPLALVRTKLQASTKPSSLGATFANIIKKDGPTGLYRGIGPNMLKVIPAVSISYAMFEQMRMYLGLSSK